MEYPRVLCHKGLPRLPEIYPGQKRNGEMDIEHFRHHLGWINSGNLVSQLDKMVHATPADYVITMRRHVGRMRHLARTNGYDVPSMPRVEDLLECVQHMPRFQSGPLNLDSIKATPA